MPCERYKTLWKQCNQQFDSYTASKWMVTVLKIASKAKSETDFAKLLLNTSKLPTVKNLQDEYLLKPKSIPEIQEIQHSIEPYNDFLTSSWSNEQNPTGGTP
jgi:hypothetical protein